MGKWDFMRKKYPKVPLESSYGEKLEGLFNTRVGDIISYKNDDGSLVGYKSDDLAELPLAKKLRDCSERELELVYKVLRRSKSRLDALVSTNNLEMEAITRLFIEKFEEDGTSSKTFIDGVSISHNVEPYAQVKDPAALRKWVLDHGMEDMLTLNWQTLNGMVKERLEGKVNEPLPDGVEVFMKDKLGCRGLGKLDTE
jgi:hypothetical protein